MKILICILLFISTASAQQTISDLTAKKFQVVSTSVGSKPCPLMTETQRNAIVSPLNGQCIYNTTTSKLNVYNGAIWKAAGGGVDSWVTATIYAIDDLVIESNRIYKCLIAHTSGTFATDLAAVKWVEISAQAAVNLTGPITSVGNATSVASQTGTGSTFVMDNTPTLITPNIGAASGTSLNLSGNISAYNYDKDNMLVNGNFENPLSSEWTCTVGTCSRTTTSGEFSKDTAALKVALSAQAMNVSQTVSTPLGIQKQGYARVLYRVPATMADFQICSIVNSAEQTCVPTNNLIKDDTFRSIEIPLIFNATNAGIKFKTTSAYTDNAYFDAAIVAQGLGTQNLMLDNVYSAKMSPAGVISTENKDWINGNCTSTVCNFNSGIFTETPNCWAVYFNETVSDGIVRMVDIAAITTSSMTLSDTKAGIGSNVMNKALFCQKSGNDYLASSANVYSQASAGTEAIYAKTSSSAVLDGTAEARFTLAGISTSNKGFIQVQDDAPNTRTKFVALKESIANVSYTAIQGSIGQEAAIYKNGAVFTSSNTAYTSGTFVTITASVPLVAGDFISLGAIAGSVSSYYFSITATPSTNYIVGSFEGIEKCTGATECVDVLSAQVTTTSGAVTNSNVSPNWLSCTAANPTVCTFASGIFTVAPNCTTSVAQFSAVMSILGAAPTSTGLSVYTFNLAGAAQASVVTDIICQKSGVDSKPKTAKVASSIGVPTVPGITTQAIDTFSFTFGTTNITTACTASPCFVDQIGSGVSSVTRSAAGQYALNTVKTYSKLKCFGQAPDNGSGNKIDVNSCNTCSSLNFKTPNNLFAAYVDTYGTIMCQGSY